MKEKYFVYVSKNRSRNVETYQTEEDKKLALLSPDKPQPFHTKQTITEEPIIFYNEKHALAYGKSMKEFLGVVYVDPGDSEDQKVFAMTASEVKALNLPKIQPDSAINKVVIKEGQSYLWRDYFKK